MKKIVLEEYAYDVITGSGKAEKRPTSDKEILKIPLENQPVGGRNQITFAELKKIDSICTKIDEAKKELFLENADYAFLKKKFNEYPAWATGKNSRKFILKAGEKLEKAEDVKVDEKKAGGKKNEGK